VRYHRVACQDRAGGSLGGVLLGWRLLGEDLAGGILDGIRGLEMMLRVAHAR